MEHISKKKKSDPDYYSLHIKENLERCKVDSDYLGEVIIANEKLLWYIIRRYVGNPEVVAREHMIEKDDILQMARVGFLKAIKVFDTSRKVSFPTFVINSICWEIKGFLRDNSRLLRPTRAATELIYKLNSLISDAGEVPPTDEMAKILNEDEDKITKALLVGGSLGHLDAPICDNSDTRVIDLVACGDVGVEEQVVEQMYLQEVFEKIEQRVGRNAGKILELYLLGRTYRDISEQVGIAKSTVTKKLKAIKDEIKANPQTYGLRGNS